MRNRPVFGAVSTAVRISTSPVSLLVSVTGALSTRVGSVLQEAASTCTNKGLPVNPETLVVT